MSFGNVSRFQGGFSRDPSGLVGLVQKVNLNDSDSGQNQGKKREDRSKKSSRVSDEPFHKWLIEFAALCFCMFGGLAVCAISLMVLMQGNSEGDQDERKTHYGQK